MARRSRAVLIILDGFGIGKDSPFNAINNAKMPFYRTLMQKYPHSELLTHGESVGLPEGVMGNSEVGHMTMGAGRIIFQDLVRINRSIQDRSFFKNPVISKTLKQPNRVHLMGLLSDGGVHSHIDHLFALLEYCQQLGVPRISVHAFLDGRDTPPRSSMEFVKKLIAHPTFSSKTGSRATLATVMGRYWAIDRDKRWDRIEKAFAALTGDLTPSSSDVLQTIEASHSKGVTDEFVEPVVLDPSATIRTGDGLFFFNYRSDRARQISEKFLSSQDIKLSAFAGMTVYDPKLALPAAFQPQDTNRIFPEILENQTLTQFRIAETEKYAHVTFFFNGGREATFKGEERVLVPSAKDIPTYDLKPEMGAPQIAAEAVKRIETAKYDFILMNFANADMVGHTGNYAAAVKAMECLDHCLSQVIGAAEKNGYDVLVTADHGNAECMQDENGEKHTQHTLNPVPAIWIAPGTANAPRTERKPLNDGTLADIAPTLCALMGISQPQEMTGRSLLP